MLEKFIDHTVLKPESTEADVVKVCVEAELHGFASVCILPWHVRRAWEELGDSDVAVCTVVGFPLGATITSMKVAEAVAAMEQGAKEIDMVAAITALKSKRYDDVFKDIRAVTEAVHERGGLVKVIIETCLLDLDEKKRMCAAVTQAGADFIKTSTGFSSGGATIADVKFLREHVGTSVRVKASGGIRDKETALAMIDAGASRLGTSSGVSIVS